MKRCKSWKLKDKLHAESGFTLLEMVLAAGLITIFFTMAAFVLPVWYKAYAKSINLNYARQIADSVLGTVSQQIRFGNNIEVIEPTPGDNVQRLTGKDQLVRFYIPMKDTTNMIDGLVYDEDFFMHNDIKLGFVLSADKSYCTITVEVSRDGKRILQKTRAVMLAGENGGTI